MVGNFIVRPADVLAWRYIRGDKPEIEIWYRDPDIEDASARFDTEEEALTAWIELGKALMKEATE
jgi:hypothetical protein